MVVLEAGGRRAMVVKITSIKNKNKNKNDKTIGERHFIIKKKKFWTEYRGKYNRQYRIFSTGVLLYVVFVKRQICLSKFTHVCPRRYTPSFCTI